MIGPPSTSGVTKCTVQPWTRAPSASARRCVCEPGVARQQRRMDVDQPPLVARDECVAEHAHEARQHDEVGLAGRRSHRQSAASKSRAGGEATMVDDGGRDAARSRDRKARRLGDGCRSTCVTAPSIRPASRRLDQRRQVGAAARRSRTVIRDSAMRRRSPCSRERTRGHGECARHDDRRGRARTARDDRADAACACSPARSASDR